MCPFGSLCVLIVPYASLWVHIDPYASFYVLMGSLCVLMDSNGSL